MVKGGCKDTKPSEADKDKPLNIPRKEESEGKKEEGGFEEKNNNIEDKSEGNKGRWEGHSNNIEGDVEEEKKGRKTVQ